MKLNGLNNIGFQGLPKPSAKPSPAKDAKSSFEGVLGQSKVEPKPDAKADLKPISKNEVKKDSKKDFDSEDKKPSLTKALEGKALEAKPPEKAGAQAEEQSAADVESLPLQPGAPNLTVPVGEKFANPPMNEPVLVAPGAAKEKPIISQEDGVDSLTRRVVWNDFLRKMKDDLGVSAEDVLAAFASLTDQELAEPPAQTVNTVVAALGLNPEQAQTAKNYFTELIAKTKSHSMGEELGKSQKQINLTLMSQRDAQRKALNHAVDQLNDSFFMKNPEAARLTQAQLQQQLQPQWEKREARSAPTNLEMVEVAAPSSTAIPGMSVKASTADFGPNLAPAVPGAAPLSAGSGIPEQNPAMSAKAKPEVKNTIDEMIRQFMSPQAKVESLKAGEVSAAPAAATEAGKGAGLAANSAVAAAALAGASGGSLKSVLEDLSGSMDSDDDKDFTSDASYLTAGLAGQHKELNLAGPAPEFQAQLNEMSKQPMSVPDLVDKAQIMVHEGGGEMKVTLTPEGMGEVAMKVSVNEGKVQVQMITESDEAKKLIERQLGELKSQLHSNNLSLDTIKIDTATNLGKQLEQQYQDAQRQATQTAWEQFRQDNQGWRRSFFETPSAKLYKGQTEAQRDVQAPALAPTARKQYNRRLDLVA